MKKLLVLVTMALLAISVLPVVMAAGTGAGVGGTIGVEQFKPIVWQCGQRVLTDEVVQPWRVSAGGTPLTERNQHYIFEGEKYQVEVVVFDKNKVEADAVDLILGTDKGAADYNVNCIPIAAPTVFADCNARIQEEAIAVFDANTMKAYTCTITALDSEHMKGPYWMSVIATNVESSQSGQYDEIAQWFFNPMITLTVDGALDFSDVRPGTASYSTVSLKNDAEGGVLLDMFITGKDWPAADSSMGRCQEVDAFGANVVGSLVNYLPLGAFRYYAENGAYSTRGDAGIDVGTYGAAIRNIDVEGYVNIHKQLNAGFEEAMFDNSEILQAGPTINGAGYAANVLYPGSTGMSITMRLMLPEPCYGNFEAPTDGAIFFWGEAI